MFKKFIFIFTIFAFAGQILNPVAFSAPASFVSAPTISRPFIHGMTIHADDPFRLDFHVDRGDAVLPAEEYREESLRMFRYFLAALAIPEDQLWVNLSPTEPDRIAVEALKKTELGQTMLAQDLELKKFVSEVLSPEHEAGKKFWDTVYGQGHMAHDENQNNQTIYHMPNTNDLIQTFNKVWIVPDRVTLHVKDGNVFIVDSHLKVLSEQDYAAGQSPNHPAHIPNNQQQTTNDLIKQYILPVIEQEVNVGKRFEELRRMFRAVVLASWYRRSLRNSPLQGHYIDASGVKSIASGEEGLIDQTYQNYLDVFRTASEGVLRETYDPSNQQVVARKYMTGGVLGRAQSVTLGDFASLVKENIAGRSVDTFSVTLADSAMMVEEEDMIVPLVPRDREKLYPADLFPTVSDFFKSLRQWRLEHPGWNLLVLARHPESASNLFEYVQTPTTFSPITLRGQKQVEAMVGFLGKAGIHFDMYYASDQERVYQMINAVVDRLDSEIDQYIVPLKRLREAGLLDGMPHGLPNDFARKVLPVNVLRLMKNNPYVFMTDRYSISQVESSLQQLKDISSSSKGQNILIGTHGVTTILALMTFLGIDYHKFKAVEEALTSGGIPYVGLTGVAVNPQTGEWRLLFHPDNSYLPELLREKRTASQISTASRKKEMEHLQNLMKRRLTTKLNPYSLSDWFVGDDFGKIDKDVALDQARKVLRSIGREREFDQIDLDAVIAYSRKSLFDQAMMNPGGVDFNVSRMTWSGTSEDYSHFYNSWTDDVLGDILPVIQDVMNFDSALIR